MRDLLRSRPNAGNTQHSLRVREHPKEGPYVQGNITVKSQPTASHTVCPSWQFQRACESLYDKSKKATLASPFGFFFRPIQTSSGGLS